MVRSSASPLYKTFYAILRLCDFLRFLLVSFPYYVCDILQVVRRSASPLCSNWFSCSILQETSKDYSFVPAVCSSYIKKSILGLIAVSF